MPADDLSLLLTAARRAGDIALTFFGGDNAVWDKGDDDPVSEADVAVNDFLRDTLTTARPDYGWLSEETEDDDQRLAAKRTFVVDPIDGTRAFLKGERTWSHSLAVVEEGVPIAGVVHLPMLNRIYAATRGGGATANEGALRLDAPQTPSRILANRKTFDAKHWPGGPPNHTRHFRPSIAYRLCLVAEGRYDAMLTFRKTWDWDVAAGALIAAEAGVTVTDARGAALTLNSPDRKSSGIFAAHPVIFPGILERALDPSET